MDGPKSQSGNLLKTEVKADEIVKVEMMEVTEERRHTADNVCCKIPDTLINQSNIFMKYFSYNKNAAQSDLQLKQSKVKTRIEKTCPSDSSYIPTLMLCIISVAGKETDAVSPDEMGSWSLTAETIIISAIKARPPAPEEDTTRAPYLIKSLSVLIDRPPLLLLRRCVQNRHTYLISNTHFIFSLPPSTSSRQWCTDNA